MRRALSQIKVLGFLLFSGSACAFNLDPSSFSNPAALIQSSVANPIVTALGLATDHKAYEGASGLGTHAGFEFSLQATLVKLPTSFNTALTQAGLATLPLPTLPVPRLMAHKGLGERVDLGFSWVGYRQIQVYGFDGKIVTWQPEEGPTWAFRLNYTHTRIAYANSGASLTVTANTLKPEILVSQKLDFAEPYIGVGYQIVNGSMAVNIPLPAPLPTISDSVAAKGHAGVGFIGLVIKPPNAGLRLVVDGEYNSAGAHALGAKFGFGI